jgi:transcription elongation GreA/GreB family factor
MAQNPAADTVVGGQPSEPNQLTADGYKRLVGEMEMLQTQQKPQLLAAAKRARLLLAPGTSLPTLDSIQSDLLLADQRIIELEKILRNVEIIGDGPVPETVQPGWGVTVRYDDEQKLEQVLTVVGPLEADVLRGFITADSAVGRALLGKPVGAKVKASDGPDSVDLTVDSIEKAPVGGAQ